MQVFLRPSVILLAAAMAGALFVASQQSDTAQSAVTGAGMSISLTSGDIPCVGKPAGRVCVPFNGKFAVTLSADAIPASGYVGHIAFLQYGATGLTSKGGTSLWPDGAFGGITFLCAATATSISCGELSGLISPPASLHKGDLVSYSFNCTAQ